VDRLWFGIEYRRYATVPVPSCREIGPDVHWLSVPDTVTQRFENLWPIPEGVNYNAYLIGSAGEYMLIDSAKRTTRAKEFIDLVKTIVDPGKIKHIVVLHTEPDHSGLVSEVSSLLPDATLYGTARACTCMKRMFNVEPKQVKGNDVLKVGSRSLRVVDLPWIHWPDSMFLYLEDEGILFTSDAYGAFGALEKPLFDDEIDFSSYLRQKKDYFSTVVVGYRTMVLRDIDKIKTLGLNIKMLAPAHGVVYRSKIQEFTETMTSWCKLQKKRKITVVYGSMYGLTEKLAHFALDVLKEKVDEVVLHDATADIVNPILSDILDSAGILFVTPTYETNIFPPVANLLELLRMKKLGEEKLAGGIVTKLWGGNAPALMATRLKQATFKVHEPIREFLNYPSEEELRSIREFLLSFSEIALQGV
jgi:flavorubredoxin